MEQKKAAWEGLRTKSMLKILCFAGILLLFLVTRVWQLTLLPFGLHADEAGMAYDAWCLSQYGVDRYLKPWPVYLINFGGGQNALYTFVCAVLMKIFGCSIQVIRAPAVIFSFLNLFFGMKLAEKLYPGRIFMPFAVGGLITICPCFILAGRFGLESNLMLGMSTVFLYCFTSAIEQGKLLWYVLAGVTGGLLLYTYAPTYIILPFFLALTLIYLLFIRRFVLKGWLAMAVPMGILALPLILVQIVNMFDLEEFQLGCFTITKLPVYRAAEVEGFAFAKLLRELNSIFIGDGLAYNSVAGYDNLYGITILFVLLGLMKVVRTCKRRKGRFGSMEFLIVILLWFLSVFYFECHIESNVNRTNGIFFAVVVLAVEGMDGLRILVCKAAGSVRRGMEKAAGYGTAILLCAAYLFCFGRFGTYYFGGMYSEETYLLPIFELPVSEALELIAQDEELSGKVTWMTGTDIYYAISTLRDPHELRMQVDEWPDNRFENFVVGGLGPVSEEYNYIIRDGFEEYCEQLRKMGFTEVRFSKYSLFYKSEGNEDFLSCPKRGVYTPSLDAG